MFKLNFNIKNMETAMLFVRILEIKNAGIAFITGENTWTHSPRLKQGDSSRVNIDGKDMDVIYDFA